MITDPSMGKGIFSNVILGHSGLRVSRICFGTMTFGAQVEKETAFRMLDEVFQKGIYFFDTANVYSEGESERILGAWSKKRRDKVVIASKVRYQMGDDKLSVGLSRRTVIHEVERSLRRLETDYLDILYLHQPDDHTDPGETLRAVDDLITAGKVRVWGVSNFAAWQVMELIMLAERARRAPLHVVQPMYNLLARRIESELLPCCRKLGLAVYTYNPLAAGLLTGKHSLEKGYGTGGRFNVFPYYRDRYWNATNFEVVRTLRAAADGAGWSLTAVSLRWLLDRPGVTGIILGAGSLEHVRENLSIPEGPLPADVVRVCDEVWHRLAGVAPAYNR